MPDILGMMRESNEEIVIIGGWLVHAPILSIT